MNKLILMGNLTRDPELRYTQGEKPFPVVRFDVAVNRRFAREGEETSDFFYCVAFGAQAEFVKKYFKKASRMLLTGHVQNNNYTNQKGEKVYGFQVIVEEVEFAERRSRSENASPFPADENISKGEGIISSVPEEKLTEPEEDFTKLPETESDPFKIS